MGCPLVHFEVIGRDPAVLREFYRDVFGWAYQIGDATTDTVSDPGTYGFIHANTMDAVPGVNGGIGGGPGHQPRVLFYIQVPSVADALAAAEHHGGTRILGPEPAAAADFTVGRLADPEGNIVGVAGPR